MCSIGRRLRGCFTGANLGVATALCALTVVDAIRTCAAAIDYPVRTVRMIVPFAAGGTADLMTRIVGDALSRKWGQAVVIENKAGAGGNIGAEAAFHAEPDGYTLLASPAPPLVVNQNLYPKLGYEPSSFVPISVLGIVPNALVVTRRVTADTVADFIAYAGANPGKVTAATQGNGSTAHLTSAMFQMMAKVRFVHVPYRGSAPTLQGMLAGDCDIIFDNLGVSLPLVKSGQLNLLGVGTTQRMPSLPDVPTLAETLPGFFATAFFAVAAPPGTPREIVAKVSADIAEVIRLPSIRSRFDDLSAPAVGSDPEATARFFAEETDRWRTVIKTADVKLD